MSNDGKKVGNPLMAAVKPLARQYVNGENVGRVFDNITDNQDLAVGEKPVLLISRGNDGVVYGGVYAYDTSSQTVTRQFSRVPVDELLLQLLA